LLGSDGVPLTTVIVIDPAPTPGTFFVHVAAGGGQYLVLYGDSGHVLRAVRVRSDGLVLDPVPLELASDPETTRYPSVDFDGTAFVVVWMDSSSTTLVKQTRVSLDGRELPKPATVLVDVGSLADSPDLACNPAKGSCLLSYSRLDLHTQRVFGRFVTVS